MTKGKCARNGVAVGHTSLWNTRFVVQPKKVIITEDLSLLHSTPSHRPPLFTSFFLYRLPTFGSSIHRPDHKVCAARTNPHRLERKASPCSLCSALILFVISLSFFSLIPFLFLFFLIHFSPASFAPTLNEQDHTTDRIEETRQLHKQQGNQPGEDTTYQTSQAWTSSHHISHCRSSVDSHSTHSCLHSWAASNGSETCCHPRQTKRNYTISRTELWHRCIRPS